MKEIIKNDEKINFSNFQKILRGPLSKVLADDMRPYLRGPLFRGPLKFFKGPLILRCLQMTRAYVLDTL